MGDPQHEVWAAYTTGTTAAALHEWLGLPLAIIKEMILAEFRERAGRKRDGTTFFACSACGTGTNFRLGARFFAGQYYCVPCGLKQWQQEGMT